MSEREQVYSGPAGEHLVLGELLRCGHESYLALGKAQKGWDIVVLPSESGPIRRIQVKAIDWPNETAVNGTFAGFDILVVVLLNREGKPKYFLFPQADLEQLISPFNSKRCDNNRTLTIGKNYEAKTELLKYKDNWSILDSTNA